jgi:hypothetical protein
MLTDFGSETLSYGTRNNCAFTRRGISKRIDTTFLLTRLEVCFDTVADQLKAIPSPFAWNVDEARLGCPKRIAQPEVIVATNPKPGSVTVPEERNDAQLTLLTAISAFGDSTCPLFISKLKTFEKALLAPQKL